MSCNLETELFQSEIDDDFPPHNPLTGLTYPKRYELYKNALGETHQSVEKGAAANADSFPIPYLNNHGPEHIKDVIEMVSHITNKGNIDLTKYEIFLLLCAIQTHDVGNIYGRSEHEKKCAQILEHHGKPYIPDSIERNVIKKIAMVHSGIHEDTKDTISLLQHTKKLYVRKVRKRLLAALLRFGDELADHTSRADRNGLELKAIPPSSLIYHHYSLALHTVDICEDENDNLQIYLEYEFPSDLLAKKFDKEATKKYLLDEIYDRTLKMEQERRYCMRYLRPFVHIDKINVKIIIDDIHNAFRQEKITYTLTEIGYPNCPTLASLNDTEEGKIRAGEQELEHLRNLGWNIPADSNNENNANAK